MNVLLSDCVLLGGASQRADCDEYLRLKGGHDGRRCRHSEGPEKGMHNARPHVLSAQLSLALAML